MLPHTIQRRGRGREEGGEGGEREREEGEREEGGEERGEEREGEREEEGGRDIYVSRRNMHIHFTITALQNVCTEV